MGTLVWTRHCLQQSFSTVPWQLMVQKINWGRWGGESHE